MVSTWARRRKKRYNTLFLEEGEKKKERATDAGETGCTANVHSLTNDAAACTGDRLEWTARSRWSVLTWEEAEVRQHNATGLQVRSHYGRRARTAMHMCSPRGQAASLCLAED